jgi:predicted dehydrogenase
MADLRVAIVGYGLAGSTFHAPFVAATPGLAVAAIVTRNEERRAQARADFPDAALVDTPADLWADAGSYDLVVVAAANDAHAPLAIAALGAGLHVVVDKPMAPTPDAARSMIEAADAAGRVLTVFHNRRWDTDFLTVRKLIDDGALGRITRFESRFERFRPALKEGAWRESPDADRAGGVLFDLGPHTIDQALVLFGPALSVYAELDAWRPGARVDDDAFVALTHKGGVRSHLRMSQTAPIGGPRLRVSGLKAAFEAVELDPQEDALRAGGRPSEPNWGAAAPARVVTADGDREIEPIPGNYLAFYEGVRDAIADGAPPPVDPLDGLRALEIIVAAKRSAAGKRIIVL